MDGLILFIEHSLKVRNGIIKYVGAFWTYAFAMPG